MNLFLAKNKKEIIFVFAWGIILTLIFTAQSIHFPLSERMDFSDSAIYQYIGYLIDSGRTPYVDAFDHKGLIFYFINALGYLISPQIGMWLLEFVFFLATTFCIYILCRKFVQALNALEISSVIVSGIGRSFWIGNTPDFFAELFLFIALYLISNIFVNNDLTKKQILATGVCSAIAFWMKPNMIEGLLIICTCIVIFKLFTKKIDFVGKCILYFIIGFSIVTIPLLMWLYRRKAVLNMVEDYFIFSYDYISFHSTYADQISASSYFIYMPTIFVIIVDFVLYLVFLLKGNIEKIKNANGSMIGCGAISFLICFLSCVQTGNPYEHYGLLLYPSATLILIGTIRQYTEIKEKKKNIFKSIYLITCFIVLMLNVRQAIFYYKYYWKSSSQEEAVENYIIQNSDEEDLIAILSPERTGFYLATGRDSATKYVYIQANHYEKMGNEDDNDDVFWNEYTDELVNNKPRIVVYDKNYVGEGRIKSILCRYLDQCVLAGESGRYEIYVMPESPEETITEFSYISDNMSVEKLVITEEMQDAYKNGEMTIEDFVEMFDNALRGE